MTSMQIHRHTKLNIFMHWFNAVCWLFLFFSGIGLIQNDDLQLVKSWPVILRTVFGSGGNLLLAHEIIGLIWACGFLIYGISRLKSDVIPFIREILTIDIRQDVVWLITKGIQMMLGYKVLALLADKFGFSSKIPDQGFYNVGQKLFAVPAVVGGILLAASGIIMILSQTGTAGNTLVQWAIVAHFAAASLVFAGLLIHIFMASIASGEQPAFFSMFTGTIPEDYARHHHKLWLDDVKKN